MGRGHRRYFQEPFLDDGELVWRDGVTRDARPRHPAAGLATRSRRRAACGWSRATLGRAVIKVSAVKPENRVVEAPAVVFDDQEDAAGGLQGAASWTATSIVVVRFQGPKANGMPELHSLSPALSVLQDAGFKVALVTDGRMSGASGKTPAAIHVSPEALDGGAAGPGARRRHHPAGRRDRRADRGRGRRLRGPPDARPRPQAYAEGSAWGYGRELFAAFRHVVGAAEDGASVCFDFATGGPARDDTPQDPNLVDRTVDA